MSKKENLLSDEPIVAKPVQQRKRRTSKSSVQQKESQEIPTLSVYALHDDVKIPERATEQAACFDIRAYIKQSDPITVFTNQNAQIKKFATRFPEHNNDIGIVLDPGERALIPTGIIFDIPDGYSIRVHPRSGLSVKSGVTLACEGIVDSDYVEETFVILMNVSSVRVIVGDDQRIAQVELVRDLKYNIERVQTKPSQKTSRSGGFGHTGTK